MGMGNRAFEACCLGDGESIGLLARRDWFADA